MSERPPVVLVMRGIIRNGDMILLLRRSEDDNWSPGLWELPGGKVDFGQSLETALAREVEEETGLVVEVRRLICSWNEVLGETSKYPDHLYFVLFYECWQKDPASQPRVSSEHGHATWMSLGACQTIASDLTAGTMFAIETFFRCLMAEGKTDHKIKVEIQPYALQITDPTINYYAVEVSRENNGVWQETIGSREHLELFIRGLRASAALAGVELEISDY